MVEPTPIKKGVKINRAISYCLTLKIPNIINKPEIPTVNLTAVHYRFLSSLGRILSSSFILIFI